MTKTQIEDTKYNGLTAGLKGAQRAAMIAFVAHRQREQEMIAAAVRQMAGTKPFKYPAY